jgi:hypothetical protein
MSTEVEALKKAATDLLEAMETCHICKGVILLDEGPIHCEDHSRDCEEHKQPNCIGIDVLHQRLKRALHSCI